MDNEINIEEPRPPHDNIRADLLGDYENAFRDAAMAGRLGVFGGDVLNSEELLIRFQDGLRAAVANEAFMELANNRNLNVIDFVFRAVIQGVNVPEDVPALGADAEDELVD